MKPLFKPSEKTIESSQMTRFMRLVNERFDKNFKSYDELYRWSVTAIESFWELILLDSKLELTEPYEKILSERKMPGGKWFDSAKINFARHLLRFNDDQLAIISYAEDKEKRVFTYKKLNLLVAKCANGMRQLGVQKGDRVAAVLPNIPEAIIGMLAATSIGAIWSSCSPDFGADGVLSRFSQIRPKLLISTNGYQYQGKQYSMINQLNEISEKLSKIEKIILIDYIDTDSSDLSNSISWDTLLDNNETQIDYQLTGFNDPVYILYSSGTTGVPKCIVHGGGGTILQHHKELVLHTNLTRDDVITYYTTCGWMMWNWLVSSLSVGATILLYDGSPAYPDLDVFWKIIQAEKITVFGTSPKFLSSCQQTGLKPAHKFDLNSLRTILSTGSPLSDENFNYVYNEVKLQVQLASISGGTDIVSCFMLGNPNLPVYSGEIQCRGLGMKVETYDDDGRNIDGEIGELVCSEPFPSMPVMFYNDPDNSKYKSAYFEHYPGAWRHGDYIKITERGGVIVYGRSDATLNPGGVRIGTAEIYSPVEAMDEIVDSVVIGQQWKNDIRIVLFVVLADGVNLNEQLQNKIRDTIRTKATPRHVPKIIIQVNDIPHTINGKKVEVAVTKIIHGQEVKNRDALANPESLEQFRNLPQLQ